jgi:TonB-linked SusC/RagA family outer membrane protein
MRRKLLRQAILSIVALFFCLASFAQNKTVTGKVTSSDDNKPMSGVTVTVKGTKHSTTTDNNGNYMVAADPGDVLQFTSIGYQMSEATVGKGNSISVKLVNKENVLGEVVVAMDIKRNPRELGYSVQKVNGNEIAQTQRQNFINGLQGRIAGLTITPTTGLAGASSQIVLRGFNSLSGSNQPLFIVDGIILDNSTLNETSNGGSGLGLASDRANRTNDYTNRIADLNPNDIESVTILKGPEATALYGSQASSGAVVITTKKAVPGKLSLNYDNSFRGTKVTRTAKLDNNFGPGSNGNGGFAGNTFTYFGSAYPSDVQKYDNIDNFFRTGFAQTHNLSADFGTKNSGFRASGSYFDDNSVVPNNEYKKMNVRLANTTKINKYITITPAIQYVNTTNDKPIRGAGTYLLSLYSWPVDNDVRNYIDANGNKKTLYLADYNSETDNPFYNAYYDHSQDKTSRYIGTLGVDLTPFKWLSVNGRFGYDHYNTTGYTLFDPQSSQYSKATGGYLDNYWKKYDGYNHTITATARKSMGKFSGRFMVGTMWQDYKNQMYAVSGSKLTDPKGTDSSNTAPNTRLRLLRNNFGEWNRSQTRQLAYFGEVGIGWDNKVFVDYTHRFEAASVFTKENRNYNYPGVSLSAVVSDIFPAIKRTGISFFKLRGSMAGTARLFDPYLNQSVFVNNFASSNVGLIYSYGFYNNNPNLVPEKQKTYEIGTELRLLNDRISIDASYYNTLCTNQILQGFRASYATGYVLNTQNAGSMRNQGVEISLDASPIRTSTLNWNLRFNFNHMWSKVLTLPESIQGELYFSDTWLYGNARGGVYRGSPTTTITGFHYLRNNKGDILINPATGIPLIDGTFSIIGDRKPDFTLGALNNINYKTWNLSFLWDLKVGGDIFNATEMYLTTTGKSLKTSDRRTPRIVNGVLKDGLENTDHPTQNNITIVPYYTNSYYTSMPEEEFVQHDVNWLRLRDVTLSYSLPKSRLANLKYFKSLSFFVTGNDLVLFTNYAGADPATNGNTAASGGVGGVGFDYANLPTPISINVGLKAGF